jgi:hypothetical protein
VNAFDDNSGEERHHPETDEESNRKIIPLSEGEQDDSQGGGELKDGGDENVRNKIFH